ncbi:NAD-dependent epimerase/dehydratase family protein [Sphingobacterium oryzagri]|uniref:NAD-dependent epimerase/dehydratase family protein n=1 Tax=Sphingobacterium oryzagri TaxID=3025669 RepID=A0ABY7WGZ0_9SPHI|nr:NAD-dependent epimerase/dehydratase family protein [Sphingobacterium sp. KACC 22765]WDF67648.1 NAD-dependent epimerase/dehydratase family protein [Sphingobacterium sp. KACC 22765]
MTYLILGCGWIGEALAQQLLLAGHQVYATTTQFEKYQRLRQAGIFAIQANFDTSVNQQDFPAEVDYVLTSVPAVKRLAKDQLLGRFEAVQRLLSDLSYKKHIFLSSIGVYPDRDGVFTEDDVLDGNHDNLQLAESMMLSLKNTIVFRLGGLFGGSRIFAKYFEDKVCTTGAQLANFVHRDDVIVLLVRAFEKELQASVYNIVAPEHPLKAEVIRASAAKYKYKLPTSFENQSDFQKFVSGRKIETELDYRFIYPSPLDF